jgi:uncharacterized Zn-binding protein involved in type VI secretion
MRGIARLGDRVTCSKCGKGMGRILTGSYTHLIEGRPIARLGDLTTCGPIVTGSYTHLIEGRPIARLGDRTACGGVIISASMEYLWE